MFENSCHVEDCRSYYFCLPRMLSSILLLLEMVGLLESLGLGEGSGSFLGLLNGAVGVTPPAPCCLCKAFH